MINNDRARGVTMRKLDTSAVEAMALDHANMYDRGPDDTPYDKARIDETALVSDRDGKLWQVCSEGVAWPVVGREITLDVYVSTPGHMSIMPTLTLKVDEWELPTTDVDLADFVRVFGARLEANFWLLHRTFSTEGN